MNKQTTQSGLLSFWVLVIGLAIILLGMNWDLFCIIDADGFPDIDLDGDGAHFPSFSSSTTLSLSLTTKSIFSFLSFSACWKRSSRMFLSILASVMGSLSSSLDLKSSS